MEPTPSKRTLKNSLYCNWVKSSTALKYFTDGLRGFVESEFTDFHRSVVNQVGVELKSFNIQPDECGQCSVHNIVPCVPSNGFCRSKKFGKCSVHIDQNKPAKCPKEICSKFFEKIKSNHKKKPSWHNTTAQKWSKDYTEVAKCFLSQNERNRNVKSITDVDTIGLLDMIENYSSTALTRTAQNDILPKCKEVRHKLFHTENFDVKDMEVKDFIKNLITLLSDEKKISDINDVKEAVILLKELGEGKIQVTLEQELEVRKEALSEVQIETEKTRIDKEYIKAQETNLEKVCENLHQYKDDVQLESMSMLTNQQDYMGLQCEYSLQLQSIHKTIKENLAEMSEKSKGDVKQMIDATLEELRQDEVNDSQVDIEQQNEHIKRLEDRVLKLEHSMDSIKETVKELGKKIEGLERLEQLHKHDIEVLSDYIRRKSDTSAQTLENILARELQELLCKRYAKKLSHVSIPFNSEKLLNVMEVHAEQVIQSAKLMGSRSVDVFSNDLGNYANILEKDEKLCKKVVLLGEIGYGKTLYFYRLLQTWVAALKKLKSKGTPLSENEKFLGQFSLIFYIDLESLGNCTYDLEMISRQIFGVPEHVLSKAKPEIYTTILQVLEKEPNECLVIIDSLDKWKQSSGHKNECLPKQQLLEECTTLIGSRQWKWNDISYTTLKDDIDNVFVISGLVNEMSTVKHVISVFCNETTPREDEKTVLEKFNKFSSKSAVNELVKIPVTLHFLIWSMFVCPCTDESLTEIYWRIVVFLFGYTKTWDRPLTVDSIQCSTLGKLNLPESFRSSEVIKQYEVVISKIALLAFKGLLSSDGQSFLVLNVSEIGKYFQKEELEIALKSGILTKERVSGCTPEKTVQLSFLCPTMQYFFAALHLAFSTAQNDKKAFKDLMSFSSIVKNIFKIESFLQFAFCIVPGLCLKFTKGICENLSDDSVTQDLHNSLKYFLMRCLKEVDKYNRPSQNECTFYLESLQLSVNDFASSEVKATLKLYQSNVGNLCQFTAITDVSNSKHDEPIDKISRHIFEHLSTATSLVNLHLTNIVLENGAATALSNLKALQILHLENIANEIRETISMTYCNNIQIVKCSCLKDIELIIGSAALTTVDLWECTSLHLKIEQGSLNYLQVNLSYFKVDELKWLKSIVCKQLRTCVLDFHNVYVHIDELVIERCTDCEVMIDQNRIEEEDLESSTASSLSGYLLDFTKITTKLWTNSSSPCFSSIQKVKVMDCCIRVKIKAFVIVSQCFIYHCMDTDLVFKSNIQDRNAFIELAEQVNESQCLERIEINTLKKDQRKNSIQFLNMPVHLKTVHLSECYDTNIVMDCFDVSVAMATAESYFTQTRSQIDKSYADRNICMVQVKDSELLLKNTSLTFNSVSMKSCQSCTVSFEIKTFEGETNPECVPRTEIVIEELKFAKISSDCLLKGLQTALVRTVRLESCEMARMDIQWRKLTSLYIDNVSELASVIVESLKSSLSLQNLVCRRMPRGTTSDLQNSVASLINLKSLDMSNGGPHRIKELATNLVPVSQINTPTSTSSNQNPSDVALGAISLKSDQKTSTYCIYERASFRTSGFNEIALEVPVSQINTPSSTSSNKHPSAVDLEVLVSQINTPSSTSSNQNPLEVAYDKLDEAEILKSLAPNQKLISLSCSCMSVESLNYLKNIEHLTLTSCSGHSIENVIKALPSLKHLKELDCSNLSENALVFMQKLGKKLLSLERFMLSNCGESEHIKTVLNCVTKMPKLKHLACRDIPGAAVSILQEKRLKQLETFEAGPFIDELDSKDLCFLLLQPNLKTIICNCLKSCNLKLFLETISKMRSAIELEFWNIDILDTSVLESLRSTHQLKGVKCRGMKSGCVSAVLASLPVQPLKYVYLEDIDSSGSPSTVELNGTLHISTLKLENITPHAMSDLMKLFPFIRDVNVLKLLHVELDSTMIEHMQILQTVKELKLHHIKHCDVNMLGECVGKLSVKDLTISGMSFHGSKLDLSIAYKLSHIKLDSVYMHPKAWVYFFEMLPRLLDCRETGIELGCVIVDHVERKHTTYVKKIELQKCCITQEAIGKVTDLAKFPHVVWRCVKDSNPTIYNALHRWKNR